MTNTEIPSEITKSRIQADRSALRLEGSGLMDVLADDCSEGSGVSSISVQFYTGLDALKVDGVKRSFFATFAHLLRTQRLKALDFKWASTLLPM